MLSSLNQTYFIKHLIVSSLVRPNGFVEKIGGKTTVFNNYLVKARESSLLVIDFNFKIVWDCFFFRFSISKFILVVKNVFAGLSKSIQFLELVG